MPLRKFTVVYFGNYDPLYTRVRTVIKGLRKNNVEVIECRSDHRNRLFRLFFLAIAYLKARGHADAILVSEGGQSYVPLAKILALITRKLLLFDAFISYYHVKAIDTKAVRPRSIKGRFFYFRDKLSCILADKTFLDTEEHVKYFCREFGLSQSKFAVLPVGSDDEVFFRKESDIGKNPDEFLVFLVSSFYPLHGVEYVVRAAKILEKDAAIKFMIIGDGLMKKEALEIADELKVKNITWKGPVPPYILPDFMAKADICLGQFGGTEQCEFVIPAKIFDSLAMAKPVITGSGRAVRSIFQDQKHMVLCPFKNAEAIANAILYLKKNAKIRENLANNGHEYFRNNFCLEKNGHVLRTLIEKNLYLNEYTNARS